MAQSYANKCEFDTSSSRPTFSNNMAGYHWIGRNYAQGEWNGVDATDKWFSENYGYYYWDAWCEVGDCGLYTQVSDIKFLSFKKLL